jgi:nicotinate-nucleotide--dimethylbenzimidazole phosphoribosyltransferase
MREVIRTPKLEKIIADIRPMDSDAYRRARLRFDSIAKPIGSLGILEEMVARIAGVSRTDAVTLDRKCLVTFCADNGIVEEGVTQTGQEVTASVAANLGSGQASAALFCKSCGADILPIDIGMRYDAPIRTRKIARGTRNFAVEDAMTRDQAREAIEIGISLAMEQKERGISLLAAGEMGIGNTSTSAAIASVLLGVDPDTVVGRGAGLSDAAFLHKREVIRNALLARHPDPSDPIDVLSKIGGFDIAGMTGFYLGAAYGRLPVVLDGVISQVAALLAVRLCPAALDSMLASQVTTEPASALLLAELGMDAPLDLNLHAGEGCAAVTLFPLLDMAARVYNEMPTFDEARIAAYRRYPDAEN